MKTFLSSHKHTIFLGLSGSLVGGAAYSYIVSLGYFTPAVGIIAGLVGSFSVAARDILSEKFSDDIPLKSIAWYVLFGILALIMGLLLVYNLVPLKDPNHDIYQRPVNSGLSYLDFIKAWGLGLRDILGAFFGSISSIAIPVLIKKSKLLEKLRIKRSSRVSK